MTDSKAAAGVGDPEELEVALKLADAEFHASGDALTAAHGEDELIRALARHRRAIRALRASMERQARSSQKALSVCSGLAGLIVAVRRARTAGELIAAERRLNRLRVGAATVGICAPRPSGRQRSRQ